MKSIKDHLLPAEPSCVYCQMGAPDLCRCMTPEQQTPASVVELCERLRRLTPSGSNSVITGRILANPDGPEAANMIERLSAEREVLREALEKISTERCDPVHVAVAALTQGESRQTLPAAPTPADGGGE